MGNMFAIQQNKNEFHRQFTTKEKNECKATDHFLNFDRWEIEINGKLKSQKCVCEFLSLFSTFCVSLKQFCDTIAVPATLKGLKYRACQIKVPHEEIKS